MSPAGFPASSKGEPKGNAISSLKRLHPRPETPHPQRARPPGSLYDKACLVPPREGKFCTFQRHSLALSPALKTERQKRRGKDGEKVAKTRGKKTNLDEKSLKRKVEKEAPRSRAEGEQPLIRSSERQHQGPVPASCAF